MKNYDVRTVNLPIADLGLKASCQSTESKTCVEDPSVSDTENKVTKCNEDSSDICTEKQIGGSKKFSGDKKSDKANEKDRSKYRTDYDLIGKKENHSFFFKTGVFPQSMPGHTGYLTFCTLYPS